MLLPFQVDHLIRPSFQHLISSHLISSHLISSTSYLHLILSSRLPSHLHLIMLMIFMILAMMITMVTIMIIMARRHKQRLGRRHYINYTEESIHQAIIAMKRKHKPLTARQASSKYDIPHATLSNKLRGHHQGKAGIFGRNLEP